MKRTKNKMILMIIAMIIVYTILLPIVPIGKFLFTEASIVRLYPHNYYLLKSLPDKEEVSFDEYMKDNGWIYSDEIEGGWMYIKGNTKKYIDRDMLISVFMDKSSVRVWHQMYTKFHCSKIIVYILFLCCMVPIFWFVITMIKSRRNVKIEK